MNQANIKECIKKYKRRKVERCFKVGKCPNEKNKKKISKGMKAKRTYCQYSNMKTNNKIKSRMLLGNR